MQLKAPKPITVSVPNDTVPVRTVLDLDLGELVVSYGMPPMQKTVKVALTVDQVTALKALVQNAIEKNEGWDPGSAKPV